MKDAASKLTVVMRARIRASYATIYGYKIPVYNRNTLSTLRALRDRGLVQRIEGTDQKMIWILTDAGNAVRNQLMAESA